VKLLFGLIVFAQVWVFIGEFVELFDEIVKDLLLLVESMKIFEVALLL